MVDNGLDLTTAVMVVLTAAVAVRKYECLKRENSMDCGGMILVAGEIAIRCGMRFVLS